MNSDFVKQYNLHSILQALEQPDADGRVSRPRRSLNNSHMHKKIKSTFKVTHEPASQERRIHPRMLDQ
jgi:hypothetical protein